MFDNLEKSEFLKIAGMSFFGFLGALVRICGWTRRHTLRDKLSSMLVGAFSGGVAGALFHNLITDPSVLGAICSMFGYMGNIGLTILVDRIAAMMGMQIEKIKE